jgi:hypothetical protein
MDDYEKRRAELLAANADLMKDFHAHLLASKVSARSAAAHLDRLSFFADVYLADYCNETLAEGYDAISGYLGDWFIRKAMWSDVGTMKQNIATFRAFYAYMNASGRLADDRLRELEEVIVNGSAIWLRHLKRYNDPRIDLEDVWDFGGDLDELLAQADAENHRQAVTANTPVGVEHFILMCSALVIRHFGISPGKLPKVDDLAGAGHWASCWRCDLAASDQASGTWYFLFTNARTLYSLVVPNEDGNLITLVELFSTILHHQFHLAGFGPLINPRSTFSLVRGQPRSLIGSQNELLRATLDLFEDPDPSLDRLCAKLNRMVMLSLPEKLPERAFLAQLAVDAPGLKESGEHPNIVPFPRSDRG